ncbi:hypothetical protein [Streptomyces sp. NPDC001068]|uniref:hypothetical protein n=1 Tax=Streptomyces sp. NPDC001068 TaxID=3364544 RepID=UPI0036B7D026
MTGHAESDAEPETAEAAVTEDEDPHDEDPHDEDPHDEDPHDEDPWEDARRARWTAAGTGALLALMGLTASLMRVGGGVPVLVPAAYGAGSAVCVAAGVLGARGRTRRALWLLILGVMIMALGDQFD